MLKKVSVKSLIIFYLVFIFSMSINAQSDTKPKTGKVSFPEKRWAVFHPFIAKKARRITNEALIAADSVKKNSTLDGDINGGKVDAFKHSYWMASLSQQIKWRKAFKLGKAHEKGNYKLYKKRKKKGLNTSHDRISQDMDLWNNEQGLEIGLSLKGKELIVIQQTLIDSIQFGKMKIIKKNSQGQYLNCSGQLIPKENLINNWENDKCLMPSNYRLVED